MLMICLLIVLPLAIAYPYGYVPNTPENIERLSNLTPDDQAWIYSGQFEGDIVLTKEQEEALHSHSRTGTMNLYRRWPNNTVVYDFGIELSDTMRDFARESLDKIEAATCIQFVQRTTEDDFVLIQNSSSGCWSSVGRIGDMQILNLEGNGINNTCWWDHIIVHEFLHAIGFYHMQSSVVRDHHVRILWENIIPGLEYNFDLHPGTEDFRQPYDHESLMHYYATAFTVNGLNTIEHLNPMVPITSIGSNRELSRSDIGRIRIMYNCP